MLNKDSLYYIFLEVLRRHYNLTHTLLNNIGIYPGQPPMLFALNKKDGQSQKELAHKLNLKPATITVMVKRMEKENLVVRMQDDKDQRISRVYLTKKGKEVFKKTNEVINNIEKICFQNFTPEEKLLLRRLFMQMKQNLIKANNE